VEAGYGALRNPKMLTLCSNIHSLHFFIKNEKIFLDKHKEDFLY